MASGKPLDEIAYSPTIVKSATMIEILVILIACIVEALWVGYHLSQIIPGFRIIAIVFGIVWVIWRAKSHLDKFSKLKRSLPNDLSMRHFERLFCRLSSVGYLPKAFAVYGLFLFVLPAFFALFGLANLALIFAFHLATISLKKLALKYEAFNPDSYPQTYGDLFVQDTVFGTSRFIKKELKK